MIAVLVFGALNAGILGLLGFAWWVTHPSPEPDLDSRVAWSATTAALQHIASLAGTAPHPVPARDPHSLQTTERNATAPARAQTSRLTSA